MTKSAMQKQGELEKYDKSLEVIVLDNGEELKFRGRELFNSLSSVIASDYENRIVKGLKEHQVISYSGRGNMPEVIKSILISNRAKSGSKYMKIIRFNCLQY